VLCLAQVCIVVPTCGNNGSSSRRKRAARCRQLHAASADVAEMVGEYNPHERDPSASMLRIAGRGWNEENLERGCEMLNRGIGLKTAAKDVRRCRAVILLLVHR
jgi:hypothetical protein